MSPIFAVTLFWLGIILLSLPFVKTHYTVSSYWDGWEEGWDAGWESSTGRKNSYLEKPALEAKIKYLQEELNSLNKERSLEWNL